MQMDTSSLPLPWIDLVVLVPLAFAAWRGFQKGLIMAVATLVALVAGLYAGFHGSEVIANALHERFDLSPSSGQIASFLLAFLAVVVAIHLLARLIEKAVKMAALSIVNKSAGLVFSVVKVALILSMVFYTLDGLFGRRGWLPDDAAADAVVFPVLEDAVTWLVPEMNHDTAIEKLKDGAADVDRAIRDATDKVKDKLGN
ncbi:CvpA family protein [bacterium]|jgi:membrane protein required for colicin V production|nr:CvpA family protein [bacterium]